MRSSMFRMNFSPARRWAMACMAALAALPWNNADATQYQETAGLGNPLNGVTTNGYAAPRLADLDGDAVFDVVLGEQDGQVRFFANTGTALSPVFSERTGNVNPFANVSVGARSVPVLVDIDGDEDLDLFVGASDGTVRCYLNTGSPYSPVFALQTAVTNPLAGVDVDGNAAPAFLDADGDGDFDVFVGGSDGSIRYYENVGAAYMPIFVERSGVLNPLASVNAGSNASPEFVRMDGDRDWDVMVGSASGALLYYENTGNTSYAVFTPRNGGTDPFAFCSFSSATAPTAGDITGSSYLQVFVGLADGSLHYLVPITQSSNVSPAIRNLFGDEVVYTVGSAPVTLDQGASASVYDPDTTLFATGYLDVAIENGVPAEDVLSIANQGAGAGQIGVNGGTVSYEGTVIGSASGGTGGTALRVTFNTSATQAAVKALIHAIQYSDNTIGHLTEGQRSVQFTVADGEGGVSPVTLVTAYAVNVNSAPEITEGVSVTVDMDEDGSPLPFSLTLHADDPDDDPLNWSVLQAPGHGTAQASPVSGGASILYAPYTDYAGADSFIIQVRDGLGGSDLILINVNVNPINDAPVIDQGAQISVTMDEDGVPTAFALSLSATDPDGDVLLWQVSESPSLGTATVDPSGEIVSVHYTPQANDSGEDTLTIEVSDGAGGADTAQVSITIHPRNDAPVLAAIGNRQVAEGSPLLFTVQATDIDSTGLTYAPQNLPAGATFDPETGHFSWTPDAQAAGVYSGVVFSVTDDGTPPLHDSETISITVTDVPEGEGEGEIPQEGEGAVEGEPFPEGEGAPEGSAEGEGEPGDIVPPVLTEGPQVSTITNTSAVITWTTDEPATSQVTYDTQGQNPATIRDGQLTTTHEMLLQPLLAGRDYTFRVGSSDAAGNGPTLSSEFAFATQTFDDTTPPVITRGPVIEQVTESQIAVRWQTNEESSSTVQYGLTEALGEEVSGTDRVQDHIVVIDGLTAGTTYYLQVQSSDPSGNGPTESTVISAATEAHPDTRAPVFTVQPVLAGTTKTTAVIVWTTDSPSTTLVRYHSTHKADLVYQDETPVLMHKAIINGLSADSAYSATCSSADLSGNTARAAAALAFQTASQDDSVPPVLTQLPFLETLSNDAAVISWITDELTNSTVFLRDDLGNILEIIESSGLDTSHLIELANLLPNSQYYFEILTRDLSGNVASITQLPFTTPEEADTQGPQFTLGPWLGDLKSQSAEVQWATDELGSGVLAYGLSAEALTSVLSTPQPSKTQTLRVSGLTANTLYYYKITAQDPLGNETVSEVMQFTTLGGTPEEPCNCVVCGMPSNADGSPAGNVLLLFAAALLLAAAKRTAKRETR